jgi:hypothetical protein
MHPGMSTEITSEEYMSLRRLRKPSAKILESTVVVRPVPPQTPTRLFLQSAVGEVVINDEGEEIAARDEPLTIESVLVGDSTSAEDDSVEGKRRPGRPKKQAPRTAERGRTPVAGSPVQNLTWGGLPDAVVASPAPVVEPEPEKKEVQVEEEETVVKAELPPINDDIMMEDQSDSDSESRQGGVSLISPSSAGGVKRKRGRPFKGQEKPIEERLMMETAKIRRLLEDVMRKGAESELCLKLRNVAREIDEVLLHFHNRQQSTVFISTTPTNSDSGVPATIDDLPLEGLNEEELNTITE